MNKILEMPAHIGKRPLSLGYIIAVLLCVGTQTCVLAQRATGSESHAGYRPLITGGMGYVHNISGGAPTLEPQVDPVLLFPLGSHMLLESRTDFTGFFQREAQTSGPFKGKVFKDVEFAQIDWLANDHVVVVAGKYLLPFGLFNERLEPIWIRNLQDPPIAASIGTRTTGAGDGLMLRGVATQSASFSTHYSAYFSVRSGINEIGAARTAGGDLSVYVPHAGVEVGTSYQRFLQQRQINSSAAYLAWEAPAQSLDVKAEYDRSFFGHGYWIEPAYRLDRTSLPELLRKVQFTGRFQDVLPSNGGGNGLPRNRTQRVDFGINYYVHDNLRFISSYGRSMAKPQNLNIWNLGVTYRFSIPLWPEGKS